MTFDDFLFEITYSVTMAVGTLAFSMRTEGRRHVPKNGPALLIANHQSFLDPFLVGVTARRQLVYMARKSLFRHAVPAWYMRIHGGIPIDQEGIGIEGLRVTTRALKAGNALLVFPEGSRTPDGRIHELKPGIHLLLRKVPVPVVPIGIAGAFDAWPASRSYPVPAPLFLPPNKSSIGVAIGRPLDTKKLLQLSRHEFLGKLYEELQRMFERAKRLQRTEK